MAKKGGVASGGGGGSGSANRLPRSNASSKMGQGRRRRDKDAGGNSSSTQRSVETIQRLKMYSNGKALRDKKGIVTGGQFMMKDRSGDRAVDGSTGRVQPDRRWFGNTRVVGSAELDKFRQEMAEKMADPYSVVLKRKKLPMGLLQDAAEYALAGKHKPSALLEQEPFEHAFGAQSRRKRVKLDQFMNSRLKDATASNSSNPRTGSEGEAEVVAVASQPTESTEEDTAGYQTLISCAQQSQDSYVQVNTREGIVPWGRDSQLHRTEGEGIDWRHEKKDDLFLKGQSKRIWGEFFKVVDCSDVILHVIDARNVPGTRCTMIERHVAKHASHKHLVFILNKVDLVPNWVAKRWMGELAKSRPTIAFHASLTHAFGKGALISLLRQFGKLHEDKKEISVGVIGYPNVGKSSVINTLISKKSCKVAPIPGETKIWQYVSLFKRISLIDCPGVVVDTAGDTETDSVLKGVVRAERLENPEDFVDAIQASVKREHIAAHYGLPKDGDNTWRCSTELLEMVAKRLGRLKKGGDPCLRSAAIMLINDYQRGRLPHYVAPPELKSDAATAADRTATDNIPMMAQDLDAIGEEYMKSQPDDGDDNDEPSSRVTEKTGSDANSDETPETGDADRKTESTQSDMARNPLGIEKLIGAGEWDV